MKARHRLVFLYQNWQKDQGQKLILGSSSRVNNAQQGIWAEEDAISTQGNKEDEKNGKWKQGGIKQNLYN